MEVIMGASSPAMNKVAFFRATYNGTNWSIYKTLTGTATAATPADAGYILTGLIEEGKYDYQEDGTLKVSWTQYNDDEAFYTFLDTVAPTTQSSGSRSSKNMEDGSKLSGDAASGNYVIMLAYTTVANNKVKTIAAVGNIAKTSGSFGTKYDDWASPTLEFTSALASADLSIPAGLFDMYNATTNAGGILDATAVGASQVIPTQSSYLRKYFLKKSS
jgi:hypothetical protein